jgi:hypothetical protein
MRRSKRKRITLVSDMTPTPDEIESAAQALATEVEKWAESETHWTRLTDSEREMYRDDARAALTAVLPLYRDRLLTELADEIDPRLAPDDAPDEADWFVAWLRSKVGGF